MTVGQIIDEVRDSYLRRFAQAVAEQRTEAESVLTEVALRDETGAPVGEGLLKRPMRLDIVPINGAKVGAAISVDSETRLNFKPVEFLWGDRLKVNLGSFWWDSVRLSVGIIDWKLLQDWFMKWFSADEDGNGEPIGVVHFLSNPKPVSSGFILTLDLGTAPVQAFEELLDALEASGATSVAIGGESAATSPNT